MQEKLRAAKRAFETKQHQASKDIILKIITSNEHEHNHRLFIKLGDICVELRQYNNAKSYYQKGMITGDWNGFE